MMSATLSRTIALAVSLAILSTLLGLASVPVAHARSAAASPACMEDQPCYRWDTMGNRSRGLFIIGRHDRIIVTVCGYVRMHARIDWTRSAYLRGDYAAWTHRGECGY